MCSSDLDAKTVWLYREQLAQAGVIEVLFEDFDGYLEKQGWCGPKRGSG